MPDAFDFSNLKTFAPQSFTMSTLKEALPEDPHTADATMDIDAANEVQDESDMKDVSMHDQFEEFDESNSESNAEQSFFQNLMSPTQNGAHRALNDTREHEPVEKEKPNEENATSVAPLQVSPLPESHLQLGSHRPAYDYELRMPIPAPWHESFAYTLSTYLHLGYKAAVIALVAYFIGVLNNDVTMKLEDRRAALVRDAAWCHHQYLLNNCGTAEAPHHLIITKQCLEYEHCMEANPDNIRRLSMYASLLAEVLSEFVHPLNFRTILSLGAMILLLFAANFAINYFFGFIRARTYLSSHPNSDSKVSNEDREMRLKATRNSLELPSS